MVPCRYGYQRENRLSPGRRAVRQTATESAKGRRCAIRRRLFDRHPAAIREGRHGCGLSAPARTMAPLATARGYYFVRRRRCQGHRGNSLGSLLSCSHLFPEQRKIAAILSSVDDAIEKTRAVIDQVQVVRRGLMQELLTRGLPGRHTRFKQMEIGEIPEEWRVVRIGQVGTVEAGRQRSPRVRGTPRQYLRVANVYDGYIESTSLLSMPFTDPEYVRYKLVPGDLLLNEGQSKDLVGRCAQYMGDPRDCCFQNTLVRFRAGDQINTAFAFWMFRHYFYSGVFSEIARQTTSVAHLGVERFANLKLALPSLKEQRTIATENIETISSREDVEQDQLNQLHVVKSALLSVLLTGELRVTPDPETA